MNYFNLYECSRDFGKEKSDIGLPASTQAKQAQRACRATVVQTVEFPMKPLWNAPGNSTENGPPAPTWLMPLFFLQHLAF